MIILITGTPGTGKSTIAYLLSSRLGYERLNVSSFLIQNHVFSEYDELRNSYVIDEDRAIELLSSTIKDNIVIETIYPSLINRADKVIVLRRDPRILYRELSDRGWNELKVAENVMAEILGIISSEAKESFEKVCEVDTSNRSPNEVVELILSDKCEEIDWLSIDEIGEMLISLDKIISKYEDTNTNEQ